MKKMLDKIALRVLQLLNVPAIGLSERSSFNPKWHQDFIIHLASILKPETYVELGVFQCGLFNRMTPFAKSLIAVDINPNAERYMKRSPKARFVAGATTAFANHLAANPIKIDFLFIDADHSEAEVERDFLMFLPFVAPHGLIALHDTHPLDELATDPERCGDAYKAIERLSRETQEFEMITLPVHPGLTLCRKRKMQLSWQENAVTFQNCLGSSGAI